MALQMHMKMEGINGESKSYAHKGWAEVLSWNWGMTSNRKLSGNVKDDKTNLNEISIIKSIGSDSAQIRMFFADGKVIPSVEFAVFPVVGKREVQVKYLNITLEDVVIKSVVTGGNMEESFFKEHISLLFDRIRFSYNKAGAAVSGNDTAPEEFKFCWNVQGNGVWAQ